MPSKVSERGQITIDQAIREELGIRPGMVAHQRVIDGGVQIVFLPAPHKESLFGILRRRTQAPTVVSRQEIETAVMDAIAEEQVMPRTNGC